jgi:hypothetical protein
MLARHNKSRSQRLVHVSTRIVISEGGAACSCARVDWVGFKTVRSIKINEERVLLQERGHVPWLWLPSAGRSALGTLPELLQGDQGPSLPCSVTFTILVGHVVRGISDVRARAPGSCRCKLTLATVPAVKMRNNVRKAVSAGTGGKTSAVYAAYSDCRQVDLLVPCSVALMDVILRDARRVSWRGNDSVADGWHVLLALVHLVGK